MGGRSGRLRPRTNRTLDADRPESTPAVLARQERFLTALIASDLNIRTACRRAKVGRTTVYGWKHGDDDYRTRYERARQVVLEDLDSSLIGRARKSDRLLTFTLERRFPELYGRQLKVEAAATVTSLDPLKLRELFAEEELVLFREFAKRAAAAKVGG